MYIETDAGIGAALAPVPRLDEDVKVLALLVPSKPANGTRLEEKLERIGEQLRKKGVESYLLLPRGLYRTLEWSRKSPPNYVERAHALLGHTVDERRVWDIAVTAQTLKRRGKGKVTFTVAGVGPSGVLAAYAALFEPAITEVIVIDPPASHRDGPIFLNVLRVLDVPEALGLLAPRPLTLIGAKDRAFDRTAAIYKAAGAADKLKRK
jgi:hypothetical protein